jgi:hypothetical protein
MKTSKKLGISVKATRTGSSWRGDVLVDGCYLGALGSFSTAASFRSQKNARLVANGCAGAIGTSIGRFFAECAKVELDPEREPSPQAVAAINKAIVDGTISVSSSATKPCSKCGAPVPTWSSFSRCDACWAADHESDEEAERAEGRSSLPKKPTVRVARAEDEGISPDEGRWVTICEEHSCFATSATKKLAKLARSVDFCDACREASK